MRRNCNFFCQPELAGTASGRFGIMGSFGMLLLLLIQPSRLGGIIVACPSRRPSSLAIAAPARRGHRHRQECLCYR